MGWLNKVKAAKNELSNAAKKTVKVISEELEEVAGGQDWYEETKKVGKDLNGKLHNTVKASGEVASEILTEFGKTEFGKSVGKSTRYSAGFLSKVPLISTATDIIRSVNGVDNLYEHLRLKPTDPERNLWLAEAMLRMERDQQRYLCVRAAIDPTMAIAQQAVKSAADLDKVPLEPSHRRLLKNAFILSVDKLKTRPNDTRSLHIISRVYLIQNDIGEATRFSKLAVLSDPSNGYPYVTLARIYSQMLQHENVNKAALSAIENGATIGNEVLAESKLADNNLSAGTRMSTYNDLRESVDQESREKYWGPSVRGYNILEAVGEAQLKKAKYLVNLVKENTF